MGRLTQSINFRTHIYLLSDYESIKINTFLEILCIKVGIKGNHAVKFFKINSTIDILNINY